MAIGYGNVQDRKHGKIWAIYSIIGGLLSLLISPLTVGRYGLFFCPHGNGLDIFEWSLLAFSILTGMIALLFGMKAYKAGSNIWLIGILIATISLMIYVVLVGQSISTFL